MSEHELMVRVPFIRVRRGLKVAFQQAGMEDIAGGPATPMARCLAKAHSLCAVLEGAGPGAFRALARGQGVSRQRLGQIHSLAFLAPDLQVAVLVGTREASRFTFHDLLAVSRLPLWEDQRRAWAAKVGRQPEKDRGTKRGPGNTHPPETAPAEPQKRRTSRIRGDDRQPEVAVTAQSQPCGGSPNP